METAMRICLLLATVFLCVLSLSDLRTRTIPGYAAPAFGIAMGILHLILQDMSLPQFLMGLDPGSVLLFLSLAFSTSLGAGDGLVVIACGAAVGPERIYAALTAALVICAVCCILLLLLKKVRRSDRLPFLPFLSVSFLVMLIAEVIL